MIEGRLFWIACNSSRLSISPLSEEALENCALVSWIKFWKNCLNLWVRVCEGILVCIVWEVIWESKPAACCPVGGAFAAYNNIAWASFIVFASAKAKISGERLFNLSPPISLFNESNIRHSLFVLVSLILPVFSTSWTKASNSVFAFSTLKTSLG